MKKHSKNAVAAAIAIIAVIVIAIGSIFWYWKMDKKKSIRELTATSIFSWEAEYMEAEMEKDVMLVMETLDCRAIYQEVPEDAAEELVVDYLRRRTQAGHFVYYLAGAKEWGLTENVDALLAQVEAVREWNVLAGKNQGFRGIVFDVEPYLLDCWDDDREEYMKQYVDNMTAAYEQARKEGMQVIACIPNFYDRIKQEKELERLIEQACDGIAIMNYNKSDETGQILTEVALAQKHQKAVINIVEMQKPGYHELTEENTYYYDGFQAVADSWGSMKEAYPYEGLGFSWHYLKPVLKLITEGEMQ